MAGEDVPEAVCCQDEDFIVGAAREAQHLDAVQADSCMCKLTLAICVFGCMCEGGITSVFKRGVERGDMSNDGWYRW